MAAVPTSVEHAFETLLHLEGPVRTLHPAVDWDLVVGDYLELVIRGVVLVNREQDALLQVVIRLDRAATGHQPVDAPLVA